MSPEIVAYSDASQLEILLVEAPVLEAADFDHYFVVRREGHTEATFPCVAVEILMHILDHQAEYLNRGLHPPCPPRKRNTALRMGSLWADWHAVDGQVGFTFYEENQRLTFLASRVIRALHAFWQQAQGPPENPEGVKGNSEAPLGMMRNSEN